MNVADSLLQALREAPKDRTPALVLADWLEERDTPAARDVAPLVRLAAQKRTPEWRKRMRAGRAALAKKHPQAAGWFDWWFGASFGPTFRLIRKPDRLALARFGVRCVRETPAGGRTAFDHITDERVLRALRDVERFVAGEPPAEGARDEVRQGAFKAAFELQRQRDPRMFPSWAVVELFSVAFPTSATIILLDASGCARYCLRAAYEIPPVPRHKLSPETLVLGFLRATVPCPFDLEADG